MANIAWGYIADGEVKLTQLFLQLLTLVHRADIEAFMIKPCTKFTRFQTLHESMIYLILQGSEDLCKAVLWDKMAAPGTPPPHNSTANTTPPSNGIDTPSLVYADSLERALNSMYLALFIFI